MTDAATTNRAMMDRDLASAALGMVVERDDPGSRGRSMRVRDDMTNGFHITHGGLVFTLADTAFAIACNEDDTVTVAAGADITFLKSTVAGQTLTATAVRRTRSGPHRTLRRHGRRRAGRPGRRVPRPIHLHEPQHLTHPTAREPPVSTTTTSSTPSPASPRPRRRARPRGAAEPRRGRGAAARAPAADRAARLRQRAAVQAQVRRGRRAPDDIRSLSDVAKFPFTTKDDLRETYPFGMFAVPMEQVARIHATSGTTGRATVVGYTKGDLERLGDAHRPVAARQRHPPGHEGAQRLRLRPVHRRHGRPRRHRGARLHGHPDVGRPDRTPGQLIQDFEPDAILARPATCSRSPTRW